MRKQDSKKTSTNSKTTGDANLVLIPKCFLLKITKNVLNEIKKPTIRVISDEWKCHGNPNIDVIEINFNYANLTCKHFCIQK